MTVALNGRNLSDVQAEAEQLPAFQDLPHWVQFVAQGDLKRSGEPSSSVASAMAIGGLITSTFLSLLVIPVVFTFIDDLGRLLRGKWKQPV